MSDLDVMRCFVAIGCLLLAASAGHVLPLPLTARSRLVEVVPVLTLSLGAPRLGGSLWTAAVVSFGTAVFLLIRLARTLRDERPRPPRALEEEPLFGAHALYAVPLLAVTFASAWSAARGTEGLGLSTSLMAALFAVRSRQDPLVASCVFPILILAEPLLLTR